MTINFKHDGQEYNRPSDQKHIDFQKTFTDKLNDVIEPSRQQIESESTGSIEVNYVDFEIQLPIRVQGFGINGRNIVLNAVKQVYESYK